MNRSQKNLGHIDRKLAFSFGAVVLMLVLTVAAVASVLYWRLQEREEDRLAGAIASILSESISRISFSGKYHARLLSQVMKERIPELAYISVETPEGIIVAHSDETQNDTSVSDEDAAASRLSLKNNAPVVRERQIKGEAVKEILVPYHGGYGGRTLGVVRVGVGVDNARGELRSVLLTLVLLNAALTAAAIVAVYFLSRHFGGAMRTLAWQLQGILDESPIAIAISDRAGLILENGARFESMFGPPRPDSVMSSLLKSRISPKLVQEMDEMDMKVFHGNEKTEKEMALEFAGKGRIWHVSKFPIAKNASGAATLMCTLINDITERRHAEAELIRQKALLDSVVESASDAIYVKDARGVYLLANSEVARILDKPLSMILGSNDAALYPPAEAATLIRRDRAVMEGDSPQTYEECLTTSMGHRTYLTTKGPLKDVAGKSVGLFGIARDITDRKRAEEERSRINAVLAAKNAELEQVVYVASHDLRSPLVNIDGYSKELANAIDDLRRALGDLPISEEAHCILTRLMDEDISESLRFIRTSTTKMDALLTGLLRLSRSGRETLNLETLDMNALIARIVDSTRFKVKEGGITLEVGDLPPCRGGAVQVGQVFSNLLDNAMKYLAPSRPGVIRINGRIEHERSVYCVEDNGIGIAPAHLDRIFEIFQRLDPARGEGEGLGLTIVRRILDRLEGDVWVESQEGSGSRFYVALPAGRR